MRRRGKLATWGGKLVGWGVQCYMGEYHTNYYTIRAGTLLNGRTAYPTPRLIFPQLATDAT